MRSVLFGLVAGVMLSIGRTSTGFGVFELPAPMASTRYGLRALSLVWIGAMLASGWQARRPSTVAAAARVLLGALGGFALHGLLLMHALPIRSWAGQLFALLLFGVLLRLAQAKSGSDRDVAVPEDPDAPRVGPVAWIGTAVAAAGAAIAIEGAARWVGLMSDGGSGDATAFGLAFLLTALVGGVSFGSLLYARALRGLVVPLGLAVLPATALMSLSVLGRLASPRGLFRYSRHPIVELTGIESSQHGMLGYGLLIGASCFVVSGMMAGATFAAARRNAQQGAALIGAGAGLWLVPMLLSATGEIPYSDSRVGRIGPDLVPLGGWIAGAGALLAILGARRTWSPRLIAAAVALAAAIATSAVHVLPAAPAAPWRQAPVAPRVMLETPEGMFTLEGRRFGVEIVTLNRRELSPGAARARLDADRLQLSMRLINPFVRARKEARVLFIGQITPGRWLTLQQEGAARVDRSAAWWRAMQTLENELFPTPERPPGDILSPAEARQRVADGKYDLVLAMPVTGDQPNGPYRMGDPDWLPLPDTTVGVAWFDARYALDHVRFDAPVLLVPDGVAGLGVGVVVHADEELTKEQLLLPAGNPRRFHPPLSGLSQRFEERTYGHLERFARRLADAAPDPAGRLLPEALVAYFGAQHRSSPYENPEARVELPVEALDALLEHSRGRRLDAFTRGLWEEIALVLRGKRWVPEILEVIPPLLEEHGPWATLQRVHAHALLESFAATDALEVLEGIEELAPHSWESWAYTGEAHRMLGDHRSAADAFREAYRIDASYSLLRALAIEAVLTGAPDAQELVEKALEEHDEDEVLLEYRGDGPYPEPDEGFRPGLFRHDHSH